MKARMLVPHGRYAQGEIVGGTVAKEMVADGFAAKIPVKKKKAPENKAKTSAPETK